MTTRMYQRGHEMYFNYVKEEWFYSDDNSSTDIERPCTRCNHLPLVNGEDYCLSGLTGCKGISNACCGHGNDEHAYILLEDGRRFVLDTDFKGDDME